MAITIFREADANPNALNGRKVAVIGYGNQGRAHALNLRDSGVDVLVGQREGKRYQLACDDGFSPTPVSIAVREADLVIIGLPDESASTIYEEHIAGVMRSGAALGFVHGFNIRYEFIAPPGDIDVIMIAPKGPGTLLRSLYLDGKGLPALLAVHQDATGNAKKTALCWAHHLGSTRAGVVETTFATETETDLFGEQVVLCGGVIELCRAAFETLVEAGYEPEFAYLECVHELKQVVDLIYEGGISVMHDRISNTAEYGGLTRGPRLITEQVRDQIKGVLREIRDGSFAKEWIDEHRRGGDTFDRLHDAYRDSSMEKAGEAVRSLMPWLANG